ncbi:di-trans,poly-cis-decaprenylcistransferase [Candidatus Woesearchaeota archaeon]|jgi:tritrans,polycis-undecaprenyl-diphosphate synthase [geranylgeranyl-diphosphate specific]|nr:di-trans,poly-cis-decaprenylcistransferase [Candidatus Woesearchaeota archaeon]MBT6045063.1 di-trans,poly-cis-decaprenylcistransferase [Candidatus Woesearchaeota archaeon]
MSEKNFPKHLGLIIDGNRRFAKKLMLKPWQGHELGAKKFRKVLTWCKDFDLKELTVYGLSTENLNRPKEEFDYLMKLFKETFDKFADDPEINENGIKIKFIGNLHLLPENIQESTKILEEKTKNNSEYLVNIALAYGGRDEIVNAAREIAKGVEEGTIKSSDVNKELFEKHLYTPDEPDMIIRTGGDQRSSNFMCYQSAYSEWFYLEKTWPEFEKEDLIKCVEEFTKRKRRYGK